VVLSGLLLFLDPAAVESASKSETLGLLFSDGRDQVWAPASSSWADARVDPTYLVGVIVNGREKGTVEVLNRDGRYLIPLDSFASITGSRVDRTGTNPSLVTALGTVDLSEGLVDIDGVSYLRPDFVAEDLATPVRFDDSQFALIVDLPWSSTVADATRQEIPALVPEAGPPSFSLSTVQMDISRIQQDGLERYTSDSLFTGRLADGRWRVRYNDNFAGYRDMREYAWMNTRGQLLYLLGLQRFDVHPVLPFLELTGVQAGWTNRPLDLYKEPTQPGELLSRRIRPTQTFRGQGPPGGVAVLKADGITVASRTIALDGTYEFLDVPHLARQVGRTEVWIYDRSNMASPVGVEQFHQSASEFLLDRGMQMHLGGLGQNGNLARDALQERTADREEAGFYQFRYGVTGNLTVEAAAQEIRGQSYFMGGLVARLPGAFVATLAAAESEGTYAYNATIENRGRRGWLLGRSRKEEAGYLLPESVEQYDHHLDAGVRVTSKLDLGFVARSFDFPSQEGEFVLPSFYWRPLAMTSIRGMPDAVGNYGLDLFSRLGRDFRVTGNWRENNRDSVALTYDRWRQTRLYGTSELSGGLPAKQTLGVDWSGRGSRRPRAYAAAQYSDGYFGARIGGQIVVLPGVLGRVEYYSDPLSLAVGGERRNRFVIGINVDLASSHKGIVPATNNWSRRNRGAIAGRVRVQREDDFEDPRLSGVAILVDGMQVTRTGPGGSFYASNLKPGIYRVDLDADGLPIELVPTVDSVVAEVAEEGVTRVDFVVRPEYGLAGRLTDSAGQNIRGVMIELVAADGSVLQSTQTDRFGLYRIDSVPIGPYSLRVAAESFPSRAEELPSRTVELSNDYLFGQDLQLRFQVVTEGPVN